MVASPLLLLLACVAAAAPDNPGLDQYKYVTAEDDNRHGVRDPREQGISHWRTQAQETLFKRMQVRAIEGVAKNLILFLGDGMSIPTLTAARIYLGQLNNQTGESSRLCFEDFPYVGLSKPYCVDKQVADSACSATAYLGGVKANYGTLGVTAAVPRANCSVSSDSRHHVDTILDWAQGAGKATGIVTTTRITHASPAGNYAHIADRDWESDHMMTTEEHKTDPSTCQDIASQLVRNDPGRNCKVLLGGGRSKFLPVNKTKDGERRDGADLVTEWREDKLYRGKTKYVSSRQELLDVDVKHTDYLLGLFQPGHMKYHLEEGSEEQPTLEEMTEMAIRMLQKEKKGFYLFVEGGKIDLAHHKNYARRALDETVEFHKAIQKAMDLVDEEDTLIVVTADHAHTMSMAGYPRRGDDILTTLITSKTNDSLPYTTLSYANGPSAEVNRDGFRRDISHDDIHNASYQYASLVNLEDETHGGDDVAVYARGPWAHLLVGNYEQNLIPHVMAYSARIGPMARATSPSAASPPLLAAPLILALAVVLHRVIQ